MKGNTYEAEGTLHKIFPTEQKTEKFSCREFVLEVPDGNFPQYIKFQATQMYVDILDRFKEGEHVKVSFDLRGREWQGKFFTTLNCWRIEPGFGHEPTVAAEEPFIKADGVVGERIPEFPEGKDLPF